MKLFFFLFIAIICSERGVAHADTALQWTLADVTRIAVENNPDLKSAQANYEAVNHTIMAALSGYLPRVDLDASMSKTTLPSPSAGATAQLGIPLAYSSFGVQLNQVLFDFGRNLAKISAARASSNSAEQQGFAVKNAVLLAVEQAFYTVIANQKLVEAAKKSLARYQETYRTTSVLVQTGARPEFDQTQATVELSKAKLALINAQNALDLSKITLINIMGLEKQPPFTLMEGETPIEVQSAQLDPDRLEQKALDARPEMKSSEFNVDSARQVLHAEVTEYLPYIGVQAFYGDYQADYPVVLRNSWGAGLTATWNLFDGLGTTARVGEFSARLDQQDALRDKERESIVAEVAGDYMNLVRAESNLEVADEALVAAKENDSLAKKRYGSAVATILELLVANGSLIGAEADAIEAKYQRVIAVERLKIAVNAPLIN